MTFFNPGNYHCERADLWSLILNLGYNIILLEPLPFPTQNVSRVREKINVPYICKSSINYFKTCISTDVRRSKNIQKNIKFG